MGHGNLALLNNSQNELDQRFSEPSVLSLMFMGQVQETGKQKMILPQVTSPSSIQQFRNFRAYF